MPRLRSKAALVVMSASLTTVLAIQLLFVVLGPQYLINFTDSVPRGMYRLTSLPPSPERGLYVVFEPPETAKSLAAGRPWFRPEKLFLKQVAALSGDTVCNQGGQLVINGEAQGQILQRDRQDRPLPYLTDCVQIGDGQVFLLGPHSPWSFDSRYFGIVDYSKLLARANLLK